MGFDHALADLVVSMDSTTGSSASRDLGAFQPRGHL